MLAKGTNPHEGGGELVYYETASGGAVFSAEDPGWGRIAPDGSVATRPAPPMADLRPAREQRLASSADGMTVEFATAAGLQRFDAAAGRIAKVTAPDDALATARIAAPAKYGRSSTMYRWNKRVGSCARR